MRDIPRSMGFQNQRQWLEMSRIVLSCKAFTGMTMETVLAVVEGGHLQNDGSWLVLCPAHDDRNPSLHVTPKGGWPLFHCFAGCSYGEIVEAIQGRIATLPTIKRESPSGLRLRLPELGTSGAAIRRSTRSARQGIATVDHEVQRWRIGNYAHIRFEDSEGHKTRVIWAMSDGTPCLRGSGPRTAELPLYGVEFLAGLNPGDVVYLTEGEPAADALRWAGVTAVATVTGADGLPCEGSLRPLAAFSVRPWADADAAGDRHMRRIIGELLRLGCASLEVISWPDAPPKGDAVDFCRPFAARNDIAGALTAIEALPRAAFTLSAPEIFLSDGDQRSPSPAEMELPIEFWEARPELSTIRAAAHARMVSANALMHVTLARVAAAIPHTLGLPPTIGGRVGLSYFVCVVSAPGTGKSSASGLGRELLPWPSGIDPEGDGYPVGTGEGLIEVMFDWVEEDKKKEQVRFNAMFTVDEGDVITILGSQRSGSTLLSTLRSIWTGATVGQANASKERKRILPAGAYTYGLVCALQDVNAHLLLDAGDVGTPQRFAWVSGMDPSIPDEPVAWPGQLRWRIEQVRRVASQGRLFMLDPTIEDEIRRAHLQRVRGKASIDLLDAHANLMRLKQAALLAALNGRIRVTQEDWHLGGMLQAASAATMRQLRTTAAARAAEKEKATSLRLARREVDKQKVTTAHRVVECANRIRDKVLGRPGGTVSEVRRELRAWTDVFDDGLEHAVAQHWIEEKSEPGQGAAKRVLYPVKKKL